jgi:hypothetical protein
MITFCEKFRISVNLFKDSMNFLGVLVNKSQELLKTDPSIQRSIVNKILLCDNITEKYFTNSNLDMININ